MRHYDYIIADVRLRSNYDLATHISGFKPFVATHDSATVDAVIEMHDGDAPHIQGTTIGTSYLRKVDADSVFMRTERGYSYEVTRKDSGSPKAIYSIDLSTNHIDCYQKIGDHIDTSILRFGLWVMFGIVIAPMRGIAIHSSTIEWHNRCALFLGESGTGKSTHTRLWCENIEGTNLLNDDSPIIRIIDNTLRIYGSPWSGKTPCYINRSYAVAGFVRLSQAPHNRIKRINKLMAIGALLPSCPHLFAHDSALQDEICKTLSMAIATTPVYSLECLPDAEAAHLSHSTLFASWLTA